MRKMKVSFLRGEIVDVKSSIRSKQQIKNEDRTFLISITVTMSYSFQRVSRSLAYF